MYPIMLAGAAAVFVFVERSWALQRRFIAPDGLVRALTSLVQRGDFATAETTAVENDTPFARVAVVGLRARLGGRAAIKEAMEETGQIEASRLTRLVGVAGTVATVTPLLGLLGTVLGMIQVFQDVAEQIDPQIGVLARGIWQALLTTGAGLTVAIPSFLAYRFLLGRAERLSVEMEERSLTLLELIISHQGAAGSAMGSGAGGQAPPPRGESLDGERAVPEEGE